jgi:hypothetical protein
MPSCQLEIFVVIIVAAFTIPCELRPLLLLSSQTGLGVWGRHLFWRDVAGVWRHDGFCPRENGHKPKYPSIPACRSPAGRPLFDWLKPTNERITDLFLAKTH